MKPVLTLAPFAPPAEPINLTALSGGYSELDTFAGGDFVTYENNAFGNQRKLLGGSQIVWTPFANTAGVMPVFAQYLSQSPYSLSWLLQDAQGFAPFYQAPGTGTTSVGGGWVINPGDPSQVGNGIQATLPLLKQATRQFFTLLQLEGGVYTVSASFADSSIMPPPPLVFIAQAGYSFIRSPFVMTACAFEDTAVTVKVTRTGVDTRNGLGFAIVPQASWLTPDTPRQKPRAFGAWMMSRNRGT